MAGRENARKLKESVKDSTTERERERGATCVSDHVSFVQMTVNQVSNRPERRVTGNEHKHKNTQNEVCELFSTSRSHDEEEQQDEEDV